MAARVVVARRAPVGSRVVLGPRVVVRSYAPFGRYGYYGPGWGYPLYPTYAVRQNTGEVKIDTHMKDASLYVDGGYVGPVGKFKKFSLSPGNHDIELRDTTGRHVFDQRVHVLVGVSIQLRPNS
jgi:hypothetical protein